ncbi:MAG: histone deacetylase [Crenarchaeota archaeon]|nr:histone deacetylase [Thermoproteota archaeon]
MRNIVVIYDDAFLKHTPPKYHCESPARVKAIIECLRSFLPDNYFVKPRFATPEDLYMVHDKRYVDLMMKFFEEGGLSYIDGDTYISPGTRDAALAAAGSAMTGVDLILSGDVKCFYAPVRPPGHHAGIAGRALSAPTQGFCIFNNIAIGAEYATRRGAKRVAIVDIDAHHGNGTQEIFYHTSKVLYISIHQDPLTLYPGTGFTHEVGVGDGEGYNINIPLPPGSGDDVYIEAMDNIIIPVLEQYKPDIILVSLGFDAHINDPLTQLEASLNTYENMYLIVKKFIDSGKVKGGGFLLEGGYDTGVLSKGSEILVKLFLGKEYKIGEDKTESGLNTRSRARKVIKEVIEIHSRYWNLK